MAVRAHEAQAIDLVRARGTASVEELSRELGVSPSSVRRLLQRLAGTGQLVRTYGGAAAVGRAGGPSLRGAVAALSQKRRIGRAAASMVGDGQTIVIGSGTTCLEMARQIQDVRSLTVITNSLDVANLLLDRDEIQLVVLGGVVRPGMHSLLGHLTEQACRELRADTLYMGIGGLSPADGLMNDYMPEVLTDRAIRPMAKSVVVLADSSKFDSVGPAVVFGLDEVDTIVTDEGASPPTLQALKDRGIKVVLA